MIKYPWLNTTYNKILQSYYANRGHHAIILYAIQNYGENELINNIVQWLMCVNPYKMEYCNICHNCSFMRTGYHPDYYQLGVDNNSQSIGVDEIRSCINDLHTTAKCSKVKVVFIKNAEYLTHQAANVLLKTIEEPPLNTYFFLKTRNDVKIPITLSSRCIKWMILPPLESQGLLWLMKKQKKIDKLSAQTALRLSCGSPIEANVMFQLNFWQYRIELCKIIKNVIINNNFLELLPSLLKIHQYQNRPVYWLITILVDSLKWKQKVHTNFLTNLDQLNLIVNISDKWTYLSLKNQVNQWLVLFYYLQKLKNVNYELLLTYRLLNWKLNIVETYF